MLEELFGSKNRERVLPYILTNNQGYGQTFMRVVLTPYKNS